MCDTRKFVLSSLALLLLSGCSQDTGIRDLQNYVADTYRDKKPAIEQLPAMKPHETFVYTASDLPDPFKIENLRGSKKPTQEQILQSSRRREPLERYPLDSLKMVGTLFQSNNHWVIVHAPDGTIHSAKVGNYVGQKNGVIKEVTEGNVEVVEQVRAPSGGWQDRAVNINLEQE